MNTSEAKLHSFNTGANFVVTSANGNGAGNGMTCQLSDHIKSALEGITEGPGAN